INTVRNAAIWLLLYSPLEILTNTFFASSLEIVSWLISLFSTSFMSLRSRLSQKREYQVFIIKVYFIMIIVLPPLQVGLANSPIFFYHKVLIPIQDGIVHHTHRIQYVVQT